MKPLCLLPALACSTLALSTHVRRHPRHILVPKEHPVFDFAAHDIFPDASRKRGLVDGLVGGLLNGLGLGGGEEPAASTTTTSPPAAAPTTSNPPPPQQPPAQEPGTTSTSTTANPAPVAPTTSPSTSSPGSEQTVSLPVNNLHVADRDDVTTTMVIVENGSTRTIATNVGALPMTVTRVATGADGQLTTIIDVNSPSSFDPIEGESSGGSGKGNASPMGAIIGTVVAVLLFILVIVVVFYIHRRLRKQPIELNSRPVSSASSFGSASDEFAYMRNNHESRISMILGAPPVTPQGGPLHGSGSPRTSVPLFDATSPITPVTPIPQDQGSLERSLSTSYQTAPSNRSSFSFPPSRDSHEPRHRGFANYPPPGTYTPFAIAPRYTDTDDNQGAGQENGGATLHPGSRLERRPSAPRLSNIPEARAENPFVDPVNPFSDPVKSGSADTLVDEGRAVQAPAPALARAASTSIYRGEVAVTRVANAPPSAFRLSTAPPGLSSRSSKGTLASADDYQSVMSHAHTEETFHTASEHRHVAYPQPPLPVRRPESAFGQQQQPLARSDSVGSSVANEEERTRALSQSPDESALFYRPNGQQ